MDDKYFRNVEESEFNESFFELKYIKKARSSILRETSFF